MVFLIVGGIFCLTKYNIITIDLETKCGQVVHTFGPSSAMSWG